MGGSPNAISVSPSKYFLGDDGNWSTFSISVGNPPQQLNVLPSTLIPSTWVIPTTGCGVKDPPNCSQLRGNLFTISDSTTWQDQKGWTLGAEANAGWDQYDAGEFGYDALSLATPKGAASVKQLAIAAINTTDTYTGVLGLAARNVTLTEQTPSLLATLRNASQIPSLSYSYTAGANYNQTFGALTLGGYDASSFEPNGVSFGFGPDTSNYLQVGLQAINFRSSSSSNAKTTSLLQDGIITYLDSTIAPFWLPQDACDAFADAFGLTFDDYTLKYKINDTAHASNIKNNPSVQLQLGNTAAGGQSVTINFPYSAFDVNFTSPTSAATPSFRYFPLRQAADNTQYVLGRTFFQEAVVTVDFERRNFSVAQALNYPSTTAANIINIISPSDTTTQGGASPTETANPSSTSISVVSSSSSSFPTGAIAGIVIAVVAIIAGIIAFFWIRRRRSARGHGPKAPHESDPDTPGAPLPPVAEKPLPPELNATKSDYFSQQPYQHTKNISVTESAMMNELPSPRGGTYIPEEHGPPVMIASPAELPAGHDPAASELHSVPHTRNTSISSGPAPSGMTWLANSPPSHSPINESSPTVSAEPGWNTSHIEPGSPASAMSVSVRGYGRAHITNVRSPTGNSPPIPLGEFPGMSSTAIPHNVVGLGVLDGAGPGTLQRQGSHRSQNSQSTLVGGLSGRQSPINGNVYHHSPSAFQSPELHPQTMPSRRPVPQAAPAMPSDASDERR